MSELSVTILGTSSGKPTLSRGLTSFAITLDGVLALFDCGEGTQLQFIRAKLKPSRLALACISHFHGDHINGLPGFLSTMALNAHDRQVVVTGPRGIRDYLGVLRRLRIFVPHFALQAEEIRQPGEIYKCEGFRVFADRLDHRIETWGFRFEEADRPGRFNLEAAIALGVPKGPLFGDLQRGQAVTLEDGRTINPEQVVGPPRRGRSVAIITDTRPCHAAVRLASGVDLLIHEATYGSEFAEQAKKRGHSTAAQAATVATEANAKRLVLTHISPRYEDIRPLRDEAVRIFKNTTVAKDLARFDIPLTSD